MSALQAYVRATAPIGRDAERIGPFLATFAKDSSHPMENYAIPDDGAKPSSAEIALLISAYRQRDLRPRLEFFTEAAPDVEATLVAAGFTLERRVPVMTCSVEDLVDCDAPEHIQLREPSSDDEFRRLRSVQNVAFGESPEVSDADVERNRDYLTVLAERGETIVGGGIALDIVSGATEIVGIAVAVEHRGQGIATAITAHLTRLAHERGAETAFLTPGDVGIGTVYRRAGYRVAGECVHLSLS
ncbi:GNAT family N-acetyltransferase [Amycolatopsis rubida]|uniref:Acetyltransferase (GNAT) domain-containing protein n=1 Tax=Amycolatopsis rubida TaxID=112413 RepID=A0A1I5FTE4_9PSEU|nr:GNAT family N-acetyltransferase [Amycolatopsis rubida]SFO27012.1 Acetyltransferase (GNAT) domain-containing protein [Amycolatopsis rubida]